MIYSDQRDPAAIAAWLAKKDARAKRRGQVVGFIGADGQTHAQNSHQSFTVGRCVNDGALEILRRFHWPAAAQDSVPFIANPKHPLCLACVSAIEDDIRGEK